MMNDDAAVRDQGPALPGDAPVRTLPCRVGRKEQLAHDVVGLYLQLPAGERMPFLAGQYVDIILRDGRRRAFSLANSPTRDEYLELHVRYLPGGEFSEYVFHHLREKTLLRIRGPLGAFYWRERSPRPAILLAGGTGFAPIKSIIEFAIDRGSVRPMHLYCGARARRDLYWHALASGWARAHAHLDYVPVLSDPLPEDAWEGRGGLAHEAVLEDFPTLEGYEVYTSGPPAMVYAAREVFLQRGLDPAHLFSDAFEPAYATGHDF